MLIEVQGLSKRYRPRGPMVVEEISFTIGERRWPFSVTAAAASPPSARSWQESIQPPPER